MGLLDDAIREHLELKRKHGADPNDVAQQEQEALGPGRRNEFAQAEPAVAEPFEPEPAPEFEPVAEPEDVVPEPPEAEAVAPGYEEDPWLPDDEQADEVPADEALELRERPPLSAGEEEDVLEETPDFLQETPEHERLWFEQKPPRDFDWDK
jgi:hypothetical protein